MSWSSLASNQWVSRVDLADAVLSDIFEYRDGIPSGNDNKWVTRGEAESYVFVQSMGGGNRWVTKGELIARPVLYAVGLSFDWDATADPNETAWWYYTCTGVATRYSTRDYPTQAFQVGDYLYTDNTGSTAAAEGLWSDGVKVYAINSGGQITSISTVANPVSSKTLKGHGSNFSTDLTGYTYSDSYLDSTQFTAVKSFEGWVVGSTVHFDDNCWFEAVPDATTHYLMDSADVMYVIDGNYVITDIVEPVSSTPVNISSGSEATSEDACAYLGSSMTVYIESGASSILTVGLEVWGDSDMINGISSGYYQYDDGFSVYWIYIDSSSIVDSYGNC